MQKQFKLILSGLFAAFAVSCTKQADDSDSGYFSLYGKQFNITHTYQKDSLGYFVLVGGDSLLSAGGGFKNTISIWFRKKPEQNGSYEMKDIVETDDQLAVSGLLEKNAAPYACPSGADFLATGIRDMNQWPWTPSDRAQVSIQNGKIRVEVPATTTVYIACGLDSPVLKSVFIEK